MSVFQWFKALQNYLPRLLFIILRSKPVCPQGAFGSDRRSGVTDPLGAKIIFQAVVCYSSRSSSVG